MVITDFNGSDDAASALALQSDGKIVVAGHASTQGLWDVGLVRYNTDGSLDATFGNGGKVTTDLMSLNDWAHDLLVQPDGKIVIAGGSQHYCGNQCTEDYTTFARYNTNGSLDAGFGSGGTVLDNNHVGAQGLVRQSDGFVPLRRLGLLRVHPRAPDGRRQHRYQLRHQRLRHDDVPQRGQRRHHRHPDAAGRRQAAGGRHGTPRDE